MCTPYIKSNVMRPIKERKTDSEIKSYENMKAEMEISVIKTAVKQLNNILRPEEPIAYNLKTADELITRSRTVLAILNEQLKIMEGR